VFERFTRRAREAVIEAQAVAVATTASQTRPEHLLMALLHDEDCLAVRVLEQAGAPAAAVRAALEEQRRRHVDGLDQDDADALAAIGIDLDVVVRRIDANLGGLSAGSRRRPGFSRAAKKVLALSLREALALKHNYIGTEHLLLGLVRADDRVVADTLTGLGVDARALRQAVADVVRQAG
jgi:ATP-dependent Clp protease ATP-binding subunit ClpA